MTVLKIEKVAPDTFKIFVQVPQMPRIDFTQPLPEGGLTTVTEWVKMEPAAAVRLLQFIATGVVL